MGFPALAVHVAAVAGLAAAVAIVIRHALDAVLRLFAGIIAILARYKRSCGVKLPSLAWSGMGSVLLL